MVYLYNPETGNIEVYKDETYGCYLAGVFFPLNPKSVKRIHTLLEAKGVVDIESEGTFYECYVLSYNTLAQLPLCPNFNIRMPTSYRKYFPKEFVYKYC